uniref:Fructose-1-6-bisphosphatase class 1 C-terminal domain-containing protein n=1 Tax=Brassica oleracea var. oleracea TaxID=109376 RepID=A0A0D3B6Z9_BRAOL
MYWSSVIFVIMHGEFVLTQENIEIPKTGKIYYFKEENYQMWDESLRKYIDDLKDPGPHEKSYSASKNGMLKLLYECAPKSFMLNKVEENDHMVTREYYIQPTKLISNVWVSSDKKKIIGIQIYSSMGSALQWKQSRSEDAGEVLGSSHVPNISP